VHLSRRLDGESVKYVASIQSDDAMHDLVPLTEAWTEGGGSGLDLAGLGAGAGAGADAGSCGCGGGSGGTDWMTGGGPKKPRAKAKAKPKPRTVRAVRAVRAKPRAKVSRVVTVPYIERFPATYGVYGLFDAAGRVLCWNLGRHTAEEFVAARQPVGADLALFQPTASEAKLWVFFPVQDASGVRRFVKHGLKLTGVKRHGITVRRVLQCIEDTALLAVKYQLSLQGSSGPVGGPLTNNGSSSGGGSSSGMIGNSLRETRSGNGSSKSSSSKSSKRNDDGRSPEVQRALEHCIVCHMLCTRTGANHVYVRNAFDSWE
jgi:hypothetical protein